MNDQPSSRILFLYWGRRGTSRLVREIMRAAVRDPRLDPYLSLSLDNPDYPDFEAFSSRMIPVRTFSGSVGALARLWTIPGLRRRIATQIRDLRIDTVVNLMPHVWSPLVSSAIRSAGARYFPVCHDAGRHPGDKTGRVLGWIERDFAHADGIITMSRYVRERLIERGLAQSERIGAAFLPDFYDEPRAALAPPTMNQPFRLLVIGRLQAYKGLNLLADAMEHLSAARVPVILTLRGEGDPGEAGTRLRALGAQIHAVWQSDQDITDALDTHHLVINSHVEASQSGVVPLALGRGVPVIVTPVGGLPEQVQHGVTGFVARATTGEALAEAIETIVQSPALYQTLVAGVASTRSSRAPPAFLDRLIEIIDPDQRHG